MAIAQPTTQIDPTNGLIAYVQAIKPFHSKIIDVLVEYVVNDTVNVSITEDFKLDIHDVSPPGDIVYTCGFGYVWDAYGQTPLALLPRANIIKVEGEPDNRFVVTMPVQTPVSVVVSNTKANQVTIVTPYSVVDVYAPSTSWTVTGDIAALLPIGSPFYISSNVSSANGRYTVANAVYNSGTNTTTLTTVEPVSLLAQPIGMLNVPVDVDKVPYWPAGAAIQFSTTGQMPAPLNATTTYYFTPTKKIGVFNVSEERYPEGYDDLVDLTNSGFGELTVKRTEPFVPGELLDVTGTASVDGQYTVSKIDKDGNNFIITVLQRVPNNQDTAGGQMQYFGSYGDPYCAVAHAPPLHAETYIYEHLVFDFGPHPNNPNYDPPPYAVDFI